MIFDWLGGEDRPCQQSSRWTYIYGIFLPKITIMTQSQPFRSLAFLVYTLFTKQNLIYTMFIEKDPDYVLLDFSILSRSM